MPPLTHTQRGMPNPLLTSARCGSTLYTGGTKSCSNVIVTLVLWLPTRLTSNLSLWGPLGHTAARMGAAGRQSEMYGGTCSGEGPKQGTDKAKDDTAVPSAVLQSTQVVNQKPL